MPQIEPFEQYAARYEDWFVKHRFAYEAELRAVKAQLPESENSISIEIGVGSGRFAAPLGIVLGVEPSAKMRAIAKRRGIEVIGAVGEALPFGNSTFEIALLVTTICFVDDLETAFNEAYRILKPDGCLVIGFIDRDSPVGRLYERHKEESVFYRVARFYTTEEVVSILEKTGFKGFSFSQTIFHDLTEINEVESVKAGYGEGSFVVVKAKKSKDETPSNV
jgi:SAM-dependent methyltransferase